MEKEYAYEIVRHLGQQYLVNRIINHDKKIITYRLYVSCNPFRRGATIIEQVEKYKRWSLACANIEFAEKERQLTEELGKKAYPEIALAKPFAMWVQVGKENFEKALDQIKSKEKPVSTS